MKRWIVTAVDHDTDGNCDGKARVLTRTLRSGSISGPTKAANAISTRWLLGMITIARSGASGISKRLKSTIKF